MQGYTPKFRPVQVKKQSGYGFTLTGMTSQSAFLAPPLYIKNAPAFLAGAGDW